MKDSIFVSEDSKSDNKKKIPLNLWIELCNDEDLMDDDGFGCASNGTHHTNKLYYPSDCHDLPKGTTHIIWFNK